MANYETFDRLPPDRIVFEHGIIGNPGDYACDLSALARFQHASGLGQVTVGSYMDGLVGETAPPGILHIYQDGRALLNGEPARATRPLGYSETVLGDDFRFARPAVNVHVNTLELKRRIENRGQDADDPSAKARMLDTALRLGLAAAAADYALAGGANELHDSLARSGTAVGLTVLSIDAMFNGLGDAVPVATVVTFGTIASHLVRSLKVDGFRGYNRWSLLPYMADRLMVTRGLLKTSTLVKTARETGVIA